MSPSLTARMKPALMQLRYYMAIIETEGGQDNVLRRVLRAGLIVGQCPVVVL